MRILGFSVQKRKDVFFALCCFYGYCFMAIGMAVRYCYILFGYIQDLREIVTEAVIGFIISGLTFEFYFERVPMIAYYSILLCAGLNIEIDEYVGHSVVIIP